MNEITQIQVFVSCPSDVSSEKEVVREVCDRINKNILQTACSITLTVREWGEVFGQIGIQPQDSINAVFKNYDIYIGILWMRFGTPTRNVNPQTGSPYQSGTEEEFEIALERWTLDNSSVRINFFFKEPKAVNTTEEIDQFRKVLEFKKRIQQIGMTNPFKTTIDFKDQIYDLLSRISIQLCLEKKTELKKDLLTTEEIPTTKKNDKTKITHFINELSKDIKQIEHYIPRSVKSVNEISKNIELFQIEKYDTLTEVALRSNRLVLLGNAGTGKSIELQQLTKRFTDLSNPFIPIYKKLNTYVNEDIQDFLPPVWKEIDHEILLLLFDGLDEIQPQHFNTAIRKITSFAERFPLIKLIISCRTNFYELPSDSFPGTLAGFECFYLNDLTIYQIRRYLQQQSNVNESKFIETVYNAGYLDIITKPFFLNILISHYKEFGNLKAKRAEIIREFILSRITLDKNHFKTTLDKSSSKNEIIRLLQKVALSMEMLGRNFITSEELFQVVGTMENLNLLKYYSAFNKSTGNEDKWQFEHNNIQEYLAAATLANNKLETIRQVISFPPQFNRVKPTWVNTLSFLISIINDNMATNLVNWIISTEPEIIVKFERDRVSEELRINLFKQIFTNYKEKGIWIRSNKFTIKELSVFSQSEEVIEFLLIELSHSKNSKIVKLNAVHIIENFDFSILSTLYLERAKNVFFDLLEKEKEDAAFVYQILSAMSELKLDDTETLNRIILKFGKRKNQYIRAGLYKLIGESDSINDYIDIFLEGIALLNHEAEKTERDEIQLADESWLLKEGLSKATTPEAITKILEFFANSTNRRIKSFYETKDVFENVVNNSISAYAINPSLYELAFKLFITSGKILDSTFVSPLVTFFNETHTKRTAFTETFHYKDLDSYERGTLISTLVDRDIIDFFIDEFLKRNYTNDDVTTFYKDLLWHSRMKKQEFNPTSYFENQIHERTDVKFEIHPVIDFAAVNQRKSQESFDLLFDKEKLLVEVKLVFDKVGSTKLKYENLWELKKENSRSLDEYFSEVVLSILRDFTLDNSYVEFKIVSDWVMGPSFEYYQIGAIHDRLKNDSKIKISEHQMNHILQWSDKIAKRMDWSKIVSRTGETSESFSISKEAEILWYFIQEHNIPLPQEYLVKFTLFGDFFRNINDNSHAIIDHLCKLVNPTVINNQVVDNLNKGISISWVWKSNALYAIDNNLNSVYSTIVKNLLDESKSEYQRLDVLTEYFNKTQNINSLRTILEESQNSGIQFKVIELLSTHEDQKSFLIAHLEKLIDDLTQPIAIKLKAAGHLIELNNLKGLRFYTEYLLGEKQPLLDFHQLNFFSKLTTIGALPDLMKLLRQSKNPEVKYDKFNYLEQIVISAVHNIGVFSQENLIEVTKVLNLFITSYSNEIPHINFLQYSIERMEDQFYLSKAQSYTIEDVLEQMKITEI